MAKVLVSLPDDLLLAVDNAAKRAGLSRSGYLQRLARADVGDRQAVRASEMARIDAEGLTGHGGAVVDLLRRHRPR